MNAGQLNRFLAEATSFAKEATPHAPAGLDWDELVALAEVHGLAGILSYQFDYRFLTRVRPPESARDRLQLSFNGVVNDNVLKITQLRRLLSNEGMPDAVLLGGVAVAEALYPHIAFRPLTAIDVWVPPAALEQASAALADAGLGVAEPGAARASRPIAARLRSPDIDLSLWRRPEGLRLSEGAARELWRDKEAAPAFGPVAHRLAPADAVIAHVAALALEGLAVPRIQLVDLREMILRSDAASGFYRPDGAMLRTPEVLERARTLGLSRALWASVRTVQQLFPEAAAKAALLLPSLPARTARTLDAAVVQPALDPRRTHVARASVALRRLLMG